MDGSATAICGLVLMAIGLPIILIAIRHQVRITRIRMIDLFEKNFKLESKKLVSFEFVRGKYFVDVLKGEDDARTLSLHRVPKWPFAILSDWMLLLCAVPFMVISAMGLIILIVPHDQFPPAGLMMTWLSANILLGPDKVIWDVAVSTMGFAFAGAYCYSIRLFLRAVAAFDLSPITLLRSFTHVIMSVILAIVVVRVVPGIDASGKDVEICVGFILGFVPDAALVWVLRLSKVAAKSRNDELQKFTPSIPTTLIDGIDYFTAFRLEESNIFDVQNLATFNPIMLHIETPFGIYETVDWVAQAQLCTIVGPQKYLALKKYNIRTIFDLERAVLGKKSTESFQRMLAGILFMKDNTESDLLTHLSASLIRPTGGGSSGADFHTALPQWLDPETIRHAVLVMIDDLHVHRLREIWRQISAELGTPSQFLEKQR